MKVSELMQREPVSVAPTDTIGAVARTMTQKVVKAVVVLEGARMIGIVTAHDLLAKHASLHFPTYFSLLGFSVPIEPGDDDREIEKALATTARDIMTSPVISVAPNDDVDRAATLMIDEDVSCVPVVSNRDLVGIIDEVDIVRLLVVEENE